MGKYGNVFTDRFWTDQNFLYFRSPYGRSARILKADISTVSVSPISITKAKLEIIGNGATLASIDTMKSWAEGAQLFILKELGKLK